VRELKGTRRDLLQALSDGGWMARARGVHTGAIFGTLQRTHADGLVEADSDPDPPTRGTQYRISPVGRRLLEATLAEEQPVGQLESGQRILIVEPGKRERRTEYERVVGDVGLTGRIAWGAPLGWGRMLVFEPGVDEFQVAELAIAFERAGFRCRDAQLGALASGSVLREQADAHLMRSGAR
jgi:DNA-binding PadR family transcriptional regulator